MDEVLGAASLFVAAAFIVAARSKLGNLHDFTEELRDYQLVPASLLPAAAVGVGLTEAVGAVAVFVPPSRLFGMALLAALLVIFTLAVSRNLAAGRTNIRCACFGRHSQQLSWAIPLRNVAMALVLGAALATNAEGIPSISAWMIALLASTTGWIAAEAVRMRNAIGVRAR